MSKQSKKNIQSNSKKNNQTWYIITIIFAIIIFALFAVIFSSYALWYDTKTQKVQNLISTGCFSVALTDKTDNGETTRISLTNTYPISDAKGQNLTPYQFTITNTCDINAQYRVSLSSLSNSTLDTQFIKFLFNNVNSTGTVMRLDRAPISKLDNETLSIINTKNSPNSVSNSYLMEEGTLTSGESKTFNLRLWMSIDADIKMMEKVFHGIISVTSVSSN